MHTTTTTNYTLTLNDIAAWMDILNMQTQTALSKPLTDNGNNAFTIWATLFTSNKFNEGSNGSYRPIYITPKYTLVTNTDMLLWVKDLFTQIQTLQLPALKVSYTEGFTAALWNSMLSNSKGLEPMKAAGWADAVMAIFARWTKANPDGGDYPPPPLQGAQIWNTPTWCITNEFQPTISVLWNDQEQALKTLSRLKQLTSEQCFYLMLLLSSLSSGTTAHQQMVKNVVSANCNSMELPNSNFYTSLIYYNIMLMADPMGNYLQTNAQIKVFIDALLKQTTGTDAGSTLIKAALGLQSKLLLVSANYPMVDPYNPAIGFDTRLSDILQAINSSWAQLTPTL